MSKQKTETKLNFDPKTRLVDKYEAPVKETVQSPQIVFTMPTEVRDPKFRPEGNFLLTDIIPIEDVQEEEVFENTISSIQPNQTGQMERVDFKVEAVKSDSGLFIPKETKKDRVQKAVVVAVGTGVKEGDYEVGDIVVIKPSNMPPNPAMSFIIEIEGHPYLQIERYLLAGKYTK